MGALFVDGVKNNRNKNKLHSVIDHHNQKMVIRMKLRKVWLSVIRFNNFIEYGRKAGSFVIKSLLIMMKASHH